jgi:hypothetical protein
MNKKQNSPEASARPRRSPVATRNRLSIKNRDPNYVYRIVNDTDSRIEDLQEQGYEIVPAAELGTVGDKRVDNATAPGSVPYISVGQGIKAVVMRQRKEWYEEDQAVKQQRVDDSEQTMKNPKADYGSIKATVRTQEG